MRLEETNFSVRLIVRHPCLNPKDIAHILGVPNICHESGQPRLTPKGRPIGGIWQETLCSYEFTDSVTGAQNDEPRKYEAVLYRAIESAESVGIYFSSANDDKYNIELVIDIVNGEQVQINIPKEHIDKVSPYNINIGIEVY
ncbi:MAG: hypothetical protein AAFX78_20350 [Cyanobacteria bacterium J06638_20]